MIMRITFIATLLFLISTHSQDLILENDPELSNESQQQEASQLPTSKPTNVLDFEAEIIEGERKTPELYLQMDVGTPTIDTLLYRRSNFQDFHTIDYKRKPKFRGSRK